MKPRFTYLPALAVFTVSLAGLMNSQAQSWNGATNAWSNPASWTPNGVPAADANVTILDTTANGMTLDGTTSRSIGSLTFGTNGTRASNFTLTTQGTATNTLTIKGGIVANGAFTVSTNALTLRGNYEIPTAQTWSAGGAMGPGNDHGIFFREITNAALGGKLTLNANVTKIGSGQLAMAGTEVSGAGNIIVNDGNFKLNAGVTLPLKVTGPGNITVNNSGLLSFHRNSGTFDITRPVVMNDNSALWTRTGVVQVASPFVFNGAHVLSVDHSDVATTAAIGGTFTGAWTGAGLINRIGGSPLTLTGSLTGFTGELHLMSGVTNMSSNIGGILSAANGATLNGEIKSTGNLSLNDATIGVNPATPASLGTLGALELVGNVVVRLTSTPAIGTPFPVLTYGTISSGGIANLSIAGGNGNYRNPVFAASSGTITLSVGSEARTWNGGGVWNINSALNWVEGDKKFCNLDSVIFGDTGAGNVSIESVVMPSSITVNSSSDYTFTTTTDNLIAGTGTLTKSGTGTLNLGGANTFTGNITINGGTVKPTNSAALGANGKTITVASGATLDTNGLLNVSRDYVAVISGTGVGGNGVITNSSATGHITGFGTLRLAGDSTVGGASRWDLRPITAGTGVLDLAGFTLTKQGANIVGIIDSVATAAGSIVVNQGTLGFTRSTVSGTGSVTVNAGATVVFENNTVGSFSKPLVINGGTARVLGNPFTIGAVTLAGAATFNTEANLTVSGAVTGAGNIAKAGTGVLTYTGISTATGNIALSAGAFTLADDAGLKFTVTNAASNSVTGTGTATFSGDFTIDTSAVTVTSGSWTLVNMATLTGSFTPTFTVAGAGWTKSGAVWSKTADGKAWSFSETTGVLSVSAGSGGSSYASWIGGFNFSAFPGADLTPTGDADGDGIKNVVEMVLGTAPNQSSTQNLPSLQLVSNPAGVPAGEYFVFTYRRSNVSTEAGVTSGAQRSTNLSGTWTSSVDGTAGVVITETVNAAIPGHDVKVHIPRSLAVDGKLFGRLVVGAP